MKLLRLKITDPNGFRSLKPGFELFFLPDVECQDVSVFNPYILAGPNGSGKSNILECLGAIFYHLECQYLNFRPTVFEYEEDDNPTGYQAEKSSPNAFELEYLIQAPNSLNQTKTNEYAHIVIEKKSDLMPEFLWLNRKCFDENESYRLSSKEIKQMLPEFIVAYSSGENEIVSLPFFKMRFIHFDEYKECLIRELPYPERPEGRMVFLNEEFSQAILLSNLLLQKTDLLLPFQEEIGLECITQFRIVIKKYIQVDKDELTDDLEDTLHIPIQKTIPHYNEIGEEDYRVLDITSNLESVIEKLKCCATCSFYNEEQDELILDYLVDDAVKQAFNFYFSSPIELFQALQILLTLNLFAVSNNLKKDLYQSQSLYVNETIPTLPSDKRIMRFKDFYIQKKGVDEEVLLKSLSDGEHQFLHSLGICLLFRDKTCLYLLDEPETHFNPNWRAKFISRIRACFSENDSSQLSREMLITTHTPFLVSDSKSQYVLIFSKNTDHEIVVSRPDYNTFGASINTITMHTFGKTETIGEYAEQYLEQFEKRFNKGEANEDFLNEVNHVMGDSIEKMFFLKKVFEYMEEGN